MTQKRLIKAYINPKDFTIILEQAERIYVVKTKDNKCKLVILAYLYFGEKRLIEIIDKTRAKYSNEGYNMDEILKEIALFKKYDIISEQELTWIKYLI